MNRNTSQLLRRSLAATVAASIAGVLWLAPPSTSLHAAASAPAESERPAANLAAEIEKMKTLLPDQSHAMADVAYHMSHAWFAGQAKNWPLAKFYVDETQSHIGWAIRIKPVRKGPGNADFPLQPYADVLFKGPLADMQSAIQKMDSPGFSKAYQASLTACYACHVASEKPYLRLKLPSSPDGGVIDFQPGSN